MTIAGGGQDLHEHLLRRPVFARLFERSNLDQLEVGDHDPQQRGFNARNLELALDGAVDPYFEGFANIVFKLDNDNETEIEVEEAFMQTTDLPWGLQLKGGQFFSAFGRINPTHPHTWDFADDPLVHGRFLGSDGLRGVGAQVSWTCRFPGIRSSFLGCRTGGQHRLFLPQSGRRRHLLMIALTTDRRGARLQDFVYVPRWENSFDLSPTQTVLAGISGAFGSNETGADTSTQIYGADLSTNGNRRARKADFRS